MCVSPIIQVFIAYCAGNLIGPHLFVENESPSYPTGFLAIMITYSIGVVACFALRFYLIWENRRRDRVGAVFEMPEHEADDNEIVTLNHLDKTDKEIPQFRYLY
jgi:hypothetical protein